MKNLLNWSEVEPGTWKRLLESAVFWSNAVNPVSDSASGKSIALLFFNDSLRTRTSMELAANQLGAFSSTITPGSGTWGFSFEDGKVMSGVAAEHIQDAIGVLSSTYDAIGIRLFATGTDYEADRSERQMRRIIAAASVPVINLESAFYHPCQSLADAVVLSKHFDGAPSGKKFVLSWTCHPRPLPMAVPNSTLLMAARLGMHITIARPDSHALDTGIMEEVRRLSAEHGQTVDVTSSMEEACNGAHVIYAKAWGGKQAYESPRREKSFREGLKDWRITNHHMDISDDGIFMHCLPVRRNVVVDDAVLDGPSAMHLQQARSRVYAQKAILEDIWNNSGTSQ